MPLADHRGYWLYHGSQAMPQIHTCHKHINARDPDYNDATKGPFMATEICGSFPK